MAKTPKEALQTLQKQYARQNEFIKNNYDRVSVTLPKGTKERILQTGAASVNSYIVNLVLRSLDMAEDPSPSAPGDRLNLTESERTR